MSITQGAQSRDKPTQQPAPDGKGYDPTFLGTPAPVPMPARPGLIPSARTRTPSTTPCAPPRRTGDSPMSSSEPPVGGDHGRVSDRHRGVIPPYLLERLATSDQRRTRALRGEGPANGWALDTRGLGAVADLARRTLLEDQRLRTRREAHPRGPEWAALYRAARLEQAHLLAPAEGAGGEAIREAVGAASQVRDAFQWTLRFGRERFDVPDSTLQGALRELAERVLAEGT